MILCSSKFCGANGFHRHHISAGFCCFCLRCRVLEEADEPPYVIAWQLSSHHRSLGNAERDRPIERPITVPLSINAIVEIRPAGPAATLVSVTRAAVLGKQLFASFNITT